MPLTIDGYTITELKQWLTSTGYCDSRVAKKLLEEVEHYHRMFEDSVFYKEVYYIKIRENGLDYFFTNETGTDMYYTDKETVQDVARILSRPDRLVTVHKKKIQIEMGNPARTFRVKRSPLFYDGGCV